MKIVLGKVGRNLVGSLPYDAEVEYLSCANRGKAYVDTGVSSSNGYSISARAEIVVQDANAYFFMGAASSSSGSWWANGIVTYASNGNCYFRSGSSSSSGGTSACSAGDNDISIDFSSSGFTTRIGDYYIRKETTEQVLTDGNVFLLGHPSWNFSSSHKLYRATLSVGGIVVRDFIPVRKNGIGYMYDRVSGQLFGNAGTGAFVIGPDKVKWRNPYITDGLIAMWDGEWNAGGGKHDASATVWTDLIDGRDLSWPSSPFVIGKDYVYFGDEVVYNAGATRNFSDMYDLVKDGYTVELVFRKKNGKSLDDIADACSASSYVGNISRYSGPMGASLDYSYWNKYAQIRGSFGILTRTSQVFIDINESSVVSFVHVCNTEKNEYGLNGTVRVTSAGSATPVGALRGAARYDTLLVGCGGGQVGYAQNTPFEEINCARIYNRALTADEIAANYAVDKERFNLA